MTFEDWPPYPEDWYPDGDTCPHCGSHWTIRIDEIDEDDNYTMWACQCNDCDRMFDVIVPVLNLGKDDGIPF